MHFDHEYINIFYALVERFHYQICIYLQFDKVKEDRENERDKVYNEERGKK